MSTSLCLARREGNSAYSWLYGDSIAGGHLRRRGREVLVARPIPKEPGPWKHNPRASCMDGTVTGYDLPRVWVFLTMTGIDRQWRTCAQERNGRDPTILTTAISITVVSQSRGEVRTKRRCKGLVMARSRQRRSRHRQQFFDVSESYQKGTDLDV